MTSLNLLDEAGQRKLNFILFSYEISMNLTSTLEMIRFSCGTYGGDIVLRKPTVAIFK